MSLVGSTNLLEVYAGRKEKCMSENDYVDAEIIIECQKCGHEVGRMRRIKGKNMLVVNGIVTTFMRGVCINCGQEFHWDVGVIGLANLIQNIITTSH